MSLVEDTILVKRYRIDGLLARGKLGATYRAFDTRLSTPVAIKENYFPDSRRIAQFKQEAVILAGLHHPALPGVTDYFSVGSKHYLVMNFIEGQDLGEIIQNKQSALAEREALDYIIQVCQAVSYLHQQNPPLIHQDIKPRNIKITPAGQAVLVDFSLAQQITGQSSLPKTEIDLSSSEPDSSHKITPASDIYSLGATLYVALTAKTPPNSANLMASGGKFEAPHRLNPKLSRQLSQAVVKAMKIDPTARPQSVAAWQKELQVIAESLSPAASDKEPTPALVAPLPKEDKDKTRPTPSGRPAPAGATCWLVDATGIGYPIAEKPLVIGRHPQADIVVDESGVSRYQAQIKLDGQRCLVRDKGSANGTFLNNQRLGLEWHPLNPGDLLTIASARFHFTTTQPVKLAPPKPKSKPVPVLESGIAPPPVQTDKIPAPPPKSNLRKILAILVLVFLSALIGLVVFYGPLRLTSLPFLSGLFSTQDKPPAGQIQTVEIGHAQMTTQAKSNAESTSRANQATATTQAGRQATATAIAQHTAPTVISLESAPTLESTPTHPPPSPTVTATISPTKRPPTATPTSTPVRVAPASSGPTVIPLKSNETIDRIGVREVIDIDINFKNPAEVYTLIKGDGIYKSTNGGDSPWTKINLDAFGVVAFVIDPTNPARLYAPTWNAVLKSVDGGNTWQAKTNGLLSNRAVDVMVVDPTRPNTLYAGVGETLVVSTDGGENWSSLGYGTGLGLARFYQIVIDPFNSDIVYAAGLSAAIYKSTDAGRTFISMPINIGQAAYGLTAHPTQKDVYLAGINSAEAAIIKTENAWEFRSVSGGLIYGGADSAYSALTYAPGNPNVVYAGSGYEDNRYAKGIFKSIDGGEHWTNISHGLSINRDFGFPYYVKSIAVHPTNPDLVFAATGGGLFKSVDGGANWSLR